jgi:hypothetical protein
VGGFCELVVAYLELRVVVHLTGPVVPGGVDWLGGLSGWLCELVVAYLELRVVVHLTGPVVPGGLIGWVG